jgi:hypothetical protein
MKHFDLIIGSIFQLLIMCLFGFFLLQSILLIGDIPNFMDLYKIDFQDDLLIRKLIIIFLSILVCLFCIISYVVIGLRLNIQKDE